MTCRYLVACTATLLAAPSIPAAPPTISAEELAKWVIYAPQPEYPFEARAQHAAGNGIFLLRVQIKSGRVKEVKVTRSTGSLILDVTAMNTLHHWQFKPGILPPIKVILPQRKDPFAEEDSLLKVPVNFVLTRRT